MNARAVCIGIDPSSIKLVAVIAPIGSKVGNTQVLKRPLTGKDIVSRSHQAKKWVADVLAAAWEFGDEVYVGVESPVLGRGGAWATIQQSIVHGALIAEFADYEGVTVMQVNNTRWKKQTVGNGNAGKPLILKWAQQHFPAYVRRTALSNGKPDQDAVDALGIWHSVCITVRVRRRVIQKKRMNVRRERVGGRR